MSALGQLLDFADALRLDLVQGFAAGQPHVVHPLGVGDPQAAALTSSQQQRSHSALGDLQQSWPHKTLMLDTVKSKFAHYSCMNQTFYK